MPTPPPLPTRDLALATKVMTAEFAEYVNDKEYFAYVHKLYATPPIWRPLRWLGHLFLPLYQRNICLAHLPRATPHLGLVLLANVALRDYAAAGPALVLTSDRFDFEGLRELHEAADRIEMLRASSDTEAASSLESIFADEEYQRFRRRPLPACVHAPSHIRLFDELLTGNALVRIDTQGTRITHPFVVLFATEEDRENPAWSAAVPSKIAAPAVEILLQGRPPSLPPPLPR